MFRRIIVVSAFAAGFSSFGANASVPQAADSSRPAARTAAEGLVLAQSGDVEIYYDEFGRRVIVDAYTGEVLSVERPRRAERRQLRRQLRASGKNATISTIRKTWSASASCDCANWAAFPPRRSTTMRIIRARSLPRGLDNQFPEPPRRAFPDEPEIIAREPIERAPLDDSQDIEPKPPAAAQQPTISEPSINFGAREEVASLQILLDRKGASPGVIDGKFGSNVDKAIVSYRAITNENLKSTDAEGIKKALAASGGDPFTNYTITPTDAAGPYVASVPADYGEKAKLDRLSFTSVPEMLAERFHMDEGYLKALNPEANFSRAGTIIRVANIGQPSTKTVDRIVADKGKKQVFAYDADNKLIVSYPATIGSTDTPSPTGNHAVSRVVLDPDYTYNPDLNFKQGDNSKILTIPPGPNGPVGSVWIALDKPTYGIHGTPDPSKIGKSESHGCVRLANWDAQELAKMVKAGVMVEFVD